MPPTNLPVKSENKALAKVGQLGDLKTLLKSFEGQFRDVLPKHLTVDRMLRIATAAASRTPKLLECTRLSFLGALHTASQLGLEPNTPLGHAYMIPYWNGKIQSNEVQFQIGYRGLIELARRGGEVATIEAHVIHQNDTYRVKFGLDDALEHEPCLTGDPGPMIAVYAVAKMQGGVKKADVMTKFEVDAIRKRSKSSDSGPWVTDYEEMAKKTVIKRLCKTLPMTVELANAVAHDDHVETGHGVSPIETPFGEEIVTEQSQALEAQSQSLQQSKADQVREKLRQGQPQQQPPQAAAVEQSSEVEADHDVVDEGADGDDAAAAHEEQAEVAERPTPPAAKTERPKTQQPAAAQQPAAQQSQRRVRSF